MPKVWVGVDLHHSTGVDLYHLLLFLPWLVYDLIYAEINAYTTRSSANLFNAELITLVLLLLKWYHL